MATYEVPIDKQIAKLFIMAFVLGLAAMISYFFTDKEAEEEKREQLWLSQKQAFYWFLDAVAGSLANGLNAPLQYVTYFLHATGIKVDLPINPVTPDGVFFVVQWVLLLLICYAVIALAFVMFTFFLRKLWWLLKVALALACFGIILNDHSIDTKTMLPLGFRVVTECSNTISARGMRTISLNDRGRNREEEQEQAEQRCWMHHIVKKTNKSNFRLGP
ncbi:hypothetical protein JOQ06_002842, partial [Pogonophryne albipinna]